VSPFFFYDVKSSLSFLKCFICIILLSSLAGGQKNLIFSFVFQFLGWKDFRKGPEVRIQGFLAITQEFLGRFF
jgi:hypothetical protein